MMKKIFNLLMLTVCVVLLFGCKENQKDDRPTFTVGMECAYAPFNWTESIKTSSNYPIDGTSLYAEGYDVQIAKKIADALGYRLVIKAIEWDGLISALTSGQIDAIIAGRVNKSPKSLGPKFS